MEITIHIPTPREALGYWKAALLLAVLAMMLVWPGPLSQFGSSNTEAATDGASMSLSIGGQTGKVEVDNNSVFTVAVSADSIPTGTGYTGVQAWINYGSTGLVGKGNQVATWADCEFATLTAGSSGNNENASCLTDLLSPFDSFLKGEIFSFDITCNKDSSHTIVLLALGDVVASTSGAGFDTNIGVVPADNVDIGGGTLVADSIDVNCVAPKPEMSLSAHGPDVTCDGAPSTSKGAVPKPLKCDVLVGGQFTLSIDVNAAPVGGYGGFRTLIDYGANLTYKKAPSVGDEIVWPDLGPVLSRSQGPGSVNHFGQSDGLFPPFPASNFLGNIVELVFNCPAKSNNVIDLVASGTSFIEPDLNEIVPNVDSLGINCVNPPKPEMSLRVPASQTVDCVGGPIAGKVCVELGAKFDVIVVADVIPAQNGYFLAQAWIDYDNNGLVHKKNTVAIWPDCALSVFIAGQTVGANGANAGCQTGLISLPPSFHKGDLFSFSLTCATSAATHTLSIIQYNVAPAGTDGAVFLEHTTGNFIIPSVTGLNVNCVNPPSMSLRVDASQTIACGGGPISGKVCVPLGAKFDAIVVVDGIPAPNGYSIAQAWIDYDNNGLVHKKNTIALWPDCDLSTYSTQQDVANNGATAGCFTASGASRPASFHVGDLYSFSLTCTTTQSSHTLNIIPLDTAPAGGNGAAFLEHTTGNIIIPSVTGLIVNCAEPPKQDKPGDTDGDGCADAHENGPDETQGGQRDWQDPNDYYDVLGGFGSLTLDGVIDLPNDILGVILHFSPQGQPPYDVRFDRGQTIGANHWERDVPDGVIDLPNDILGIILQFAHNCV